MPVTSQNGDLRWVASIENRDFEVTIRRMEAQLGGLADRSNQAAGQIENFGKKAAIAIGSYLSLTAGKQFVSDLVRVRGEFQQLEVAFTTMLGSKEKADALMKEAVAFAAQTPFTLGEVATGAKQLLAYGFAVEDTTKNLNLLGNIAAGVSAPLNEITYLYGTLRAQGRAFSVDIRQFAGRGIPIYEELAKVLGVASSEVMGLVEAGKVGFPEVEKAFQNMTGEGGKFFNLMQEQSKTLTGLLSNLGDAWDVMLNAIGKDNEGVFASGIRGAISLVENYQTVIDILKVIIATYGTYRAAIIATSVVQGIATAAANGYTVAETLRYQAMLLSERATKLLNATMLANPYVAVATGIAAIVAALVIFNKSTSDAVRSQERLNDMRADAEKSIVKEKVQLEQYISVARNENLSRTQREAAIKNAIQLSPNYLKGLTLENIKTQEGIDLINNYVAAIRAKAKEQAALSAFQKVEEDRINAAVDLQTKINERLKGVPAVGIEAFKKADPVIQQYIKDNQEYLKGLEEVNASIQREADRASSELAKTNKTPEAAAKRTVKFLEEAIALEKEKRSKISETAAEYKAATIEIQKLEKELEGITGKAAGKESVKAAKDTLSDLKQILEEIRTAEAEANRSGLTTAESEIDRINARYDAIKAKVDELKIASDKKGGLLQRVENARVLQVGNEQQKNQAAEYEKYITDTKAVFDQFEKYKLDVGKEKAQELTQFQTAEYEDYIEFIKTQLALVSQDKGIGATIKKDFLIKALGEAEKGKLEEESDALADQYKDILEKTVTFNGKRKEIERKYQSDVKLLRESYKGDDLEDRVEELKRQRDVELEEVGITFAETSKEYKKLMAEIEGMSRNMIKSRIRHLQDYMAVVAEFVGEESGYYKQLEVEMRGLKSGLNSQDLERFEAIAAAAGEIGRAVQGATGDLAVMGDILVGLTSQAQNLSVALDQNASDADKISSAAGAAASLISIVIDGAAKRKQAEEAYYASVIAQQEQYNILLNDQIGMQAQLSENVFVKDFEGRMVSGMNQLKDATEKYQQALEKLEEGQAKMGQRNDVNWGAVAGGAASGAVLGAAIGSAVPVIGTIIGAVVGGVIGLIGGMKKKDVFGSLLGEYPELIKMSTNGFEELNVELAKTLVEQNLIDAKTKELLQSAIEWTEQIEEARANMKAVISELAGNLGNSLRDSLVGAFKDGTDAAKAFSDSVGKTLEDMLSQLIFSKVFNQAFTDLEEDMMTSFDFGGDGSWVDDFGRFFEQAEDLTEEFNSNLEAAQNAAAQFDIDVFKRNNQSQNQGNGLVGAYSQMTEETGNLLAGQFGGLRMTALEQLRVANESLNVLNDIRYNTSFIEMSYRILGDFKLNGIKIKP